MKYNTTAKYGVEGNPNKVTGLPQPYLRRIEIAQCTATIIIICTLAALGIILLDITPQKLLEKKQIEKTSQIQKNNE
jgi:hypothetical protein